MANEDLRVRISTMVQGLDQVESLKNAVRGLQNATTPAAADLTKLKNAAMALGSASGRTESDLRRSINALKDVRAQLSITGAEYRKLTGTINQYQRQLDKATGAQQRGGRGMQIAQTAGAVAASGVFGGPEGLIGAALGSFGGPGGALAGGAIGAQVGMLRQQVNQFATYAADISKLEIALKGITKTQTEYQRALAASASVTRDFNVPQLEATKGITQLSAAVIGAGGKVADAEVVFRNVTAAIKASGGTSEDVQGALTALGQIFSKGKVSAEELQGQLGERLPGAVTMFAKATGRTLPQLQKDLEQGVVGLADLMKFVVSDQGLGQFEQRAKDVAASSADAGARLSATWNNTRRAIGQAVLPLGAEIQDSLGAALKEATPALVEFAKGLAGMVKIIVDNSGLIADFLKTLLGFGTIVAGAVAFSKIATGIALVTTAIASYGGAAGIATLATNTLTASMLAVPGIGWIGAAIVGLGLLTKTVYDNNTTFRNWVDNIGGVVANDFSAALKTMKSDAKSAFDFIKDLLPEYEKQNKATQANTEGGWTDTFRAIRDNAFGFISDIQKAFNGLFDQLPPWARKILIDNAGGTGAGLISRVGNYVAGASQRAVQGRSSVQGTEFFGPGGAPGTNPVPVDALTRFENEQQQNKDKAAEKARNEAERLAAEQQRFAEASAKAQIEYARTVFNNQMELIRKRWDYEDQRLKMQRDIQAGNLTGIRAEEARAFNEFMAQREALRRQVREATLGVVAAEQNAGFNAQLEAVTGQGLGGGAAASTGFSAQQLQAAAREASRFTGIANMCSESVKAFYNSLGVSLPGVTAWADTVRKAGTVIKDWSQLKVGDIVATGRPGDTPHVGVYTGGSNVFHQSRSRGLAAGNYPDLDYFKQGGYIVRPNAMAGTGAQARRNVAAQGKLGSANAEVQQAGALQGLTRQNAEKMLAQQGVLFVQQRTQALRDETAQMKRNNDLALKRMKLEQSGMRPELVEAAIKKEQMALDLMERRAQIQENIAAAEGDPEVIARSQEQLAAVNTEYARQLELIDALTQAQTGSGVALANYIGQLKLQLAEMTNIENVVISMAQTIESELSSAMSNAVNVLVSGTGSVKQVFADMFKSIGASFVQMATQMIAKALIMKVLGILGGGFGGGGGGGGGGGFGGGINFNPSAFSMPSLMANGGVMTSGGPRSLPIKQYAMGGVANSPQTAVFGERGPEAYVPLPDGRSIPVKMKQRDEALNRYRPMGATGTMAADGEAATAAAGAAAGSGAIDVRYSVERINNVEYVTAEQFRAGMQQAAREGAVRGEQQTLRRLQTSVSTRKRIGV